VDVLNHRATDIAEARKRRIAARPRARTEDDLRRIQDARLARLVKATDHIAPRYPHAGSASFQSEGRFLDAVKVIRAYVKGDLMTLDRSLLRRLAEDRYGRAWLRPATFVAASERRDSLKSR
jgi:hypothetical protein